MASSIFNPIDNPLRKINSSGYDDLQGGGLVTFLSNILKMITIIGGVWSFINIIIAGFSYITAGDNPETTAKAWAMIYNSLIGLVIIVASYAIAALLGYILFGDVSAILSPNLYGVGV